MDRGTAAPHYHSDMAHGSTHTGPVPVLVPEFAVAAVDVRGAPGSVDGANSHPLPLCSHIEENKNNHDSNFKTQRQKNARTRDIRYQMQGRKRERGRRWYESFRQYGQRER